MDFKRNSRGEKIKKNENGLLVSVNSVKKLEEAIHKIYKNKRLRKKFGEKGRKQTLAKFGFKDNLKSIERLYQELWKKRQS